MHGCGRYTEQLAIMRSDVSVRPGAGTCGLRDVGNMIRRALPSLPVTSIRREDRARRSTAYILTELVVGRSSFTLFTVSSVSDDARQ